MKLTIMMPCLNEEQTIAFCIDAAQNWVLDNKYDAEVLIVDNGSTDSSVDIALAKGARVINAPLKGYGNALKTGFKEAYGEWVIFADSDGSYDFTNITPFIEKLEEGYGLVMGNRFLGGIEEGAMPWKNRYIGNPVLSFVARVVHGIPIGDFHCGMRAFNKAEFDKVILRTSGMELATEIVVNSKKAGLSICEVPSPLYRDKRNRKPHLRPWRDGFRHLYFIFMAKVRD